MKSSARIGDASISNDEPTDEITNEITDKITDEITDEEIEFVPPPSVLYIVIIDYLHKTTSSFIYAHPLTPPPITTFTTSSFDEGVDGEEDLEAKKPCFFITVNIFSNSRYPCFNISTNSDKFTLMLNTTSKDESEGSMSRSLHYLTTSHVADVCLTTTQCVHNLTVATACGIHSAYYAAVVKLICPDVAEVHNFCWNQLKGHKCLLINSNEEYLQCSTTKTFGKDATQDYRSNTNSRRPTAKNNNTSNSVTAIVKYKSTPHFLNVVFSWCCDFMLAIYSFLSECHDISQGIFVTSYSVISSYVSKILSEMDELLYVMVSLLICVAGMLGKSNVYTQNSSSKYKLPCL